MVVKVGGGTVIYDPLHVCPGLAQKAAVAQAERLREMWARLGIRIDIRVWLHEVLKVAA